MTVTETNALRPLLARTATFRRRCKQLKLGRLHMVESTYDLTRAVASNLAYDRLGARSLERLAPKTRVHSFILAYAPACQTFRPANRPRNPSPNRTRGQRGTRRPYASGRR